jgi:hypothetical protein
MVRLEPIPVYATALPQPVSAVLIGGTCSKLWNNLGPDGDHADEQNQRSKGGSFLDEHFQHRTLPVTPTERMKNIVPFLF